MRFDAAPCADSLHGREREWDVMISYLMSSMVCREHGIIPSYLLVVKESHQPDPGVVGHRLRSGGSQETLISRRGATRGVDYQ
jgi:hypothetical protein